MSVRKMRKIINPHQTCGPTKVCLRCERRIDRTNSVKPILALSIKRSQNATLISQDILNYSSRHHRRRSLVAGSDSTQAAGRQTRRQDTSLRHRSVASGYTARGAGGAKHTPCWGAFCRVALPEGKGQKFVQSCKVQTAPLSQLMYHAHKTLCI